MVAFSYPVLNQIRLLVANLSKKSYKASTAEFKDISLLYGDDAHLFLLRCLMEEIDFHDHKSQKDQYKIALLLEEMEELSVQSNFGSLICRALQESKLTHEVFSNFTRASKLPLSRQLAIALALAQAVDKKTKEEGVKFIKAKLADMNEFSGESLTVDLLHQLVFFIRDCASIPDNDKTRHVQTLQRMYAAEFESRVLAPLLFENATHGADSKMAYSGVTNDLNPLLSSLSAAIKPCNVIQDLGFQCMEKPAAFREILSQFPKLSASDVGEIVSMMVRNHSSSTMIDEKTLPLTSVFSMAVGLPPTTAKGGVQISPAWQAYLQASKAEPDSKDETKGGEGLKKWRIDVFVQVLKDVMPRLDWTEVYQNLDCPQFMVDSQEAFSLLLAIFALGTKNLPFPVHIFFSTWNNHAGQLSLIKQALQAPASLFSFTGAKRNRGGGKPMEFETDNMDAWGSVELLETLLDLSETDLYNEVRDMFLIAKEQVPEILLCGLVQVRAPSNGSSTPSPVVMGRNALHEESLSALMPVYLRQHNSNASAIVEPQLEDSHSMDGQVVLGEPRFSSSHPRCCYGTEGVINYDLGGAPFLFCD